ncbi:prephenate dehydrogenase/arogenate dehydrogenase family protein [Stutzerimonas kirkiae]|uniref:prephenate dehydrogenase/arogenate dehydrogenase family protein n=1 Tax=Stutzerimonas kirkiae TaxID=2211392 RepID=UPI001F61E953|nr:prephenate dehydrogenase/arogenate dehydrogenase family protein [Stutzerimonas kirkiae]
MKPAAGFGRVLVIGLGLIGGSFAKGLRASGLCREVTGFDLDPQTRRLAVELGVVDRCPETLEEACREADLIQLAVPILAMERLLRTLALLELDIERIVLTDVGSAKGSVVRCAAEAFGRNLPRFVPGHPIAGSEQSGVGAANPALFRRHKVILTPQTDTDPGALALVDRAWRVLGADVEHMQVEHHDEVLAATSHLPHLLAFGLVDSLARRHENLEIFRYAAGGFRDFTRIAGSDPVMWHDIFLANRDAVLATLDEFQADLDLLREAMVEKDGHHLLGVFTRARAAREHFGKILAGRAYAEDEYAAALGIRIEPVAALRGEAPVPGDKGIAQSAIVLAALAEGSSEISGFRAAEASLATLQAFRDMGVVIEGPQQGRLIIHGVGLHGLQAPPGPLYLGGSASAMGMLAGLLAAQRFDCMLTGDAALSRQPMGDVVEPLCEMGASISLHDGHAPIRIRGGQALVGIDRSHLQQAAPALLMAGLYASGNTRVSVVARQQGKLLGGFGCPVRIEAGGLALAAGHALVAQRLDIPGDASMALALAVAASLAAGSELTLEAVAMTPALDAGLTLLGRMGANIRLLRRGYVAGVPVASIAVSGAGLRGGDVPPDCLPIIAAELPVLLVAAACASGTSRFSGIGALQGLERLRLRYTLDALLELGIRVVVDEEQLTLEGGALAGRKVAANRDLHVAMALCIAGSHTGGGLQIDECPASVRDFIELAERFGMNIKTEAGL